MEIGNVSVEVILPSGQISDVPTENYAGIDIEVLNNKADIDLDNLSVVGQGKLDAKANVDLSNLSATGQGKLDAKAEKDLTNITDTGKSLIAKLGMPSDTYDDLTLGASGTTYTAPANGWYFLHKVAGASGEYTQLNNTNTGLIDFTNASGPYGITCCVVALKGHIVSCTYTTTGSTLSFKFIYAEGSKTEA